MEIIQSNSNLVYVNCRNIFEQIYISIYKFDRDKLSKRDLQKLILHFLIVRILNYSKFKTLSEKPVFYFFTKDINLSDDEIYTAEFKKALKKANKILPIPLILIDDYEVFKKNNGGLKELNMFNSQYYSQRTHNTKKLLNYLKKENFTELSEVFQHTNNIKSISN